MLSWQDQYELFQDLASDAGATNLELGKKLLRIGQRKLEALLGIYYTEETRPFTTVTDAISGTSNQAYQLFENFKSLTELYVTVGTTQYPAELIQDSELWRQINSTTTQSTSNFLQFCFIRRDRVELYPIPSSANTATMIYDAFTKPLTQDNYITGTILTLANGNTAVVGTDTVWTAGMVGRYFRIDDDGEWYKIAAFTDATHITLEKEYQGVSIAAGTSAYTIGQMPVTPPDTHILPVYYALWQYEIKFRKNRTIGLEHRRDWKDGIEEAEVAWANRSSSNIIKGRPLLRRRRLVNPNYWPQNLS